MPQPLVLAIEPDLRQAAIVKRIVREKGLADVAVVDSRDAAIEAMRTAMPDVLLLSALMSPRDEDELITHLKTLDNAGHLQTHTIPQLASSLGPGEERASRGLLSAFRRKKDPGPIASGCDPELFAEEIRVYLQRAADKKRELQNTDRAALDMRPATVKSTRAAAEQAEETAEEPSSSWSSPFEWKPASSSARAPRSAPEPRPAAKAPEPPAPIAKAPEEATPIVMAPEQPAPIAKAPEPTPIVRAPEPPPIVKPSEQQPLVSEPVGGAAGPLVSDFAVARSFLPDSPEPATARPAAVPEPIAVTEPLIRPEPLVRPEPVAAAPTVTEPLVVKTDPVPVAAAPVVPPAPPPAAAPPPVAAKPPAPEPVRLKPVAERAAQITARVQLRELSKAARAAKEREAQDRLGPLARWARTETPRPGKTAPVTADDVRALISSLAVPTAVASVRYPRGCRIRRVRVPASPDVDSSDVGPVILSKRALAEQRDKQASA